MTVELARAFLIPVLVLTFLSSSGQDKLESVTVGDSTKANSKKAFLTGIIVQAETNIPLAGAAIFIDGFRYGDNSDAKGRYLISLPPGKYRITVRYLGKAPIQKRLILFSNGVLNFEMTDKTKMLEEVIVNAKSPDENIKESIPGIYKLGIKEMRKLPAFLSEPDVIKSLLLLPGVTSVGEGSGGFNVRGGSIDQNLVLMDGGIIFNSSHALGLFSNFNPDVTEEFTLYKGNIPAQYGGRTASVLSVRTRDGDFSKVKVSAGLGFLASRIAIEGPIAKDKTSIIIGGRFSYSDWMLKTVNDIDIRNSSASFYDFNAGITHRMTQNGTISLKYYAGHDYFKYSDQFGYDYSTQLVTLKYNTLIGKKWGSTFTASRGQYNSKLYDYDPTQAKAFSNGITYDQFKQNFLNTYLEKHALNFGAETNLYYSVPQKTMPFGTNTSTVTQQFKQNNGREFALYANEEYTITPRLAFSIGFRYSLFQSVGNDTVYLYNANSTRSVSSITDTLHFSPNHIVKTYQGLEPRISMRLSSGMHGAFKVSYNRNRQYIDLVSNTSSPTPTDIWQMNNYYFKPQISDNFSFGYFQNFKENRYEFSSELFYRSTANVVDYKNNAQIILNRHLETDVLFGQGKAYGLELFLKKNSGPWTGWISYTYSRSLYKMDGLTIQDKINNGSWYPSNFDKPNILSVTGSHRLGRKMKFGANMTYNTGRPITAVESYYVSNSISIPVYSDRNKYRIPDYWRVDISVTVRDVFKKLDDNLVFSVYNFFGRHNAYSVYYQQLAGYPDLQAYKLSILGSAIPSITYNVNF
jgi:hypothetical protein